MDHLPWPDGAVYPRIRIPYLATEGVAKYCGDGFVDFPLQAGWQKGDDDWFDCEPSVAAARAQSWLFFGLLRELFGPEFSEASFVARDGEHKDFVSTNARLPSLLEERFCSKEPLVQLMHASLPHFIFALIVTLGTILFKAELRHRIFGASKKLRSKCRIALIKVEAEVRNLEVAFADCEDIHLVCLSIRALLWSVRNAAANRDFTILKRGSLELSSSGYLKRLLIERGLCPHHLATVDERLSVVTLHFLAGLDRPVGLHRDCSAQLCSANILDPLTYETKHADDACDCDFIESDMTEIRRAIDAGDVPVIRASMREGTVHLDTQRAAFDNPYVAISHVWSGGLGNPQSSSLPACQLRRIYHLLRPLVQPSIAQGRMKWYQRVKMSRSKWEDAEQGARPAAESCVFWIDTLCLPKQRPQRDQAISQMTRIYAEAQQVVVLDKGLQKIGAASPEEEILANLASSSWMSRCWTFQEGRLAQQLLINVDLSLRDPFMIYNQVALQAALFGLGTGTWTDTLQFRREIASSLYRMRPLKDQRIRNSDFRNFVDVWNELGTRTASWTEDVIIILTLMLDLSVNEVKSIPEEGARLKAILRTQHRLPISLLFVEAGSCRSRNDDCWMPKTLSNTIDIRHGGMRKTWDIGTGEPGFVLDPGLERLVLIKSTSKSPGRILGLWTSDDGCQRQQYAISLTLTEDMLLEAASDESEGSPISRTGQLYLFQKPDPLTTKKSSGYNGRGCRFKILKEEASGMAVVYDCSFSCTWELVAEPMDASELADALPQEINFIARDIDIRLKCDWRQWPSLQYHRSRMARRMTTTHTPVHPLAFLLFYLELLLGFTAIIIVIVCFPSKANNGVEPSAADWSAYAFCLAVLFCRLLYVLFEECPSLNRLVKLKEYREWTESFTRPGGDTNGYNARSPPVKVFRFRPWWVSVGFLGVGIGLLATGVIVNGANLFEITIAGGYLVGVVSLLMLTEAFWRFPGAQAFKQRLLDRLFGKYPTGLDSFSLRDTVSLKFVSNAFTGLYDKRNLDLAFGDPLYLPERYERWS